MKRFSSKFTPLLLAILLWAGCSREVEIGGGTTTGDNVDVLLSLEVPGAATTRGLTPAQEEMVKTVDVFVFDASDKLTDWRFGIMNNDGKGFTARLAPGTRRLMVLANARHITYPIFGDAASARPDHPGGDNLNGHATKSYAQVYDLLKTAMPTATATEYAAQGIPMWGMFEKAVPIDHDHRTFSIDLVRSLALIEVGTNPAPATDPATGRSLFAEHPDFSLEAVYFYNGNTSFSLIPVAGRYSYDTKQVSGYSLPAGVAKYTAPVEYSGVTRTAALTGFPSGKGYALTGAIYAAEAEVDMGGSYGDANHTARPCVIVKGRYKPDGATSFNSAPSYYRIDLRPGGTFKDLLRNNNYQISIKSVNGPGKPAAEDALESVNADMTVVITTWSNGGEGNHDIDEQYSLQVNKTLFEFEFTGGMQPLEITTDYPGGWTISASGWITTTPTSTTSTEITVSANNTSEDRSATITVTAGNMSKIVTVTQFQQINPGVLAAPGVIGYVRGTNTLTLKGSKEYASNAAIKAYADVTFGGLSDKTVYVAYFKFGSLVATRSEYVATTFIPDDIIAAPKDYNNSGNAAAALAAIRDKADGPKGTLTGTDAWNEIPYITLTDDGQEIMTDGNPSPADGTGDPCAYYTEEFGDGWILPTAGPSGSRGWYSEGYAPFGISRMNIPWTDHPTGAAWKDANEAGNGIPAGAVGGKNGDPDWTMYLPAAGFRFRDGVVNYPGSFGYYQSSTYMGSGVHNLGFVIAGVVPASAFSSASGMSVRCVRAE